jgi:hypothetical protein
MSFQRKREDDRRRQLIDSIDNVAQTVEDSSAFAQGKKLDRSNISGNVNHVRAKICTRTGQM